MVEEIYENIRNYSKEIFPYYSNSSKLRYRSEVSTNSLIYHALVLYQIGEIKQAKQITSECLRTFNINTSDKIETNNEKHSSFYKSIHKAALLTQLVCSIEKRIDIANDLLREILSDKYLEIISNKNIFINKIKSLELNNSWHDSNIIMAMFCLRYAYSCGDKHDNGLNSCIDYLIEIQNNKTGFWHSKGDYGGKLNAMAGTYHYLPLFISVNRPIPRHNLIIDSTIKLHMLNGHFSLPNGHSCIDLDAYSILAYCNSIKNKNLEKQVICFSKMFLRDIKYIENIDGGFSDFPTKYNPKYFASILISLLNQFFVENDIYTTLWNLKSIFRTLPFIKDKLRIISNSDIQCSSYINESNIFSCWFKLLTIEFAMVLNKKVYTINSKPKYLLPFIGFGL